MKFAITKTIVPHFDGSGQPPCEVRSVLHKIAPKEEDRKKLDKILSLIKCPKGLTCVETGFIGLCKARDFGNEFYIECLERLNPPCHFALVFDHSNPTRFCRCPLRVYLKKYLGK